ncbi:MAG: PTS fructose transporter subunit IIA [Clostridiales bacterium]|nr:MAG: PTS fructose transporter subunit IIA [Clostridiales bacterium]
MIGIVLTGHANFATGLLSSLKLIAGEPEKFVAVDFLENYSTEDLRKEYVKAIDTLDCEEILFFTDLVGGTPFKTAVEYKFESDKKIEVISGTNLGMLIESSFSRFSSENIEEVIETALHVGREQVMKFELKNDKKEEGVEDGI